MGTPVTTARTTPGGIMLGDGYQSLIAFAADPDIQFWEKTVTPPAMDGGEPVECTTMHNTNKIKRARSTVDWGDAQLTVGYDPIVYSSVRNIINVEGSITIHFPDGSTLDFFGYLRSFTPDALEEGTCPQATIVIVVTNVDPSDGSFSEPVMTEVAGT